MINHDKSLFRTVAHCTLRCCTPLPHCVEQGDHSLKVHASQALPLHGSSESGLWSTSTGDGKPVTIGPIQMVMTGGWFTIVLPVLSNIIQVSAITYQHDYPAIIIQKLG